jgi:hypothetical protein
MVTNIITDARTGHLWGNGGRIGRTDIRSNPRPMCISQNIRTLPLTPILCGVMLCVTYVLNSNQ